ncbi:MAG: dihydrolipoyllysine-residue acetyltransferase [Legionellales bacterium]|nr:dihydrolipoyllysine-residue acetyltransferase [Legionellales bacterium]
MLKDVVIPDLGNTNPVDVIEILVKPGDKVTAEMPLLTLESDKASMEVPSPFSGTVKELKVTLGQKVTQGALVAVIDVSDTAEKSAASAEASAASEKPAPKVEASAAPAKPTSSAETKAASVAETSAPTVATAPPPAAELPDNTEVFAGPAVRRFARELGADLTKIKGSGRKGRLQLEDVQLYVKSLVIGVQQGGGVSSTTQGGFSLPSAPVVDFAKFGEIESLPLSRIKKISGTNLQRNWILVPHVTQFDEADITELEAFRQSANNEAQKQGIKITPLVFIMKAVVAALKAFPTFNSSLDPTGESLILKKYYHIGVAVDTPNGLVVPVIRDADKKGIYEISRELAEVSEKARKKGLTANDMQGSTFTISSLGGIGGTAFTPIVNLPDVAILGVSRSSMKPIYQDGQFVPRLMLPLSLSYDHRVIDGAEGARFSRYLVERLSDIRKLLL